VDSVVRRDNRLVDVERWRLLGTPVSDGRVDLVPRFRLLLSAGVDRWWLAVVGRLPAVTVRDGCIVL
jgi:hypothetical protein